MFVLVLLLSIVAYGILMTALLHPSLRLDWDILLRVFFRPSFAVFGEPGIESFERMFSFQISYYSSIGVGGGRARRAAAPQLGRSPCHSGNFF